MATSTKTLTPTNQTVTLPDMTERPNASVLVDGIGKEADAINALDSKLIRGDNAALTNANFNDLTSGWHFVGTGSTNGPGPSYILVYTFRNLGGGIVQIAFTLTGTMFTRANNGTTWSAWKTVTAT